MEELFNITTPDSRLMLVRTDDLGIELVCCSPADKEVVRFSLTNNPEIRNALLVLLAHNIQFQLKPTSAVLAEYCFWIQAMRLSRKFLIEKKGDTAVFIFSVVMTLDQITEFILLIEENTQ